MADFDFDSAVRRVRRPLVRHRRLIAATLAAGAVFCLARVVAPAQPEVSAVVVAARDLTGGTVVRADDVRTVQMPPDVVPAGAFSAEAAALGASVAAPMRAGEPLTDRRVLGAALIDGYPAGTVASPVRIEDADVVALLRPGDRLDLYAPTGDSGLAARIVTDAVVMMLPRADETSRGGALVVLAVSQAEAAEIAEASASSMLSVSLRG